MLDYPSPGTLPLRERGGFFNGLLTFFRHKEQNMIVRVHPKGNFHPSATAKHTLTRLCGVASQELLRRGVWVLNALKSCGQEWL